MEAASHEEGEEILAAVRHDKEFEADVFEELDDEHQVEFKLGCGLAIGLGTYIGGCRIINTMGNRLTSLESPQGFSAETSSATVILLASSLFGYPLSTTQVVSGGVIGSRLGNRLASVRWGTPGRWSAAGCSRSPPPPRSAVWPLRPAAPVAADPHRRSLIDPRRTPGGERGASGEAQDS